MKIFTGIIVVIIIAVAVGFILANTGTVTEADVTAFKDEVTAGLIGFKNWLLP